MELMSKADETVVVSTGGEGLSFDGFLLHEASTPNKARAIKK